MTVRTLQEILEGELKSNDESPESLEEIRVSEAVRFADSEESELVTFTELEKYEGDIGYGGENLPRLIAWSDDWVYFKSVYDGAESIDSVPRNPSNTPAQRH